MDNFDLRFRFDDGILGGVGSGGAGYYDNANDLIYGFNQKGPWNEEEFNKFYDKNLILI